MVQLLWGEILKQPLGYDCPEIYLLLSPFLEPPECFSPFCPWLWLAVDTDLIVEVLASKQKQCRDVSQDVAVRSVCQGVV